MYEAKLVWKALGISQPLFSIWVSRGLAKCHETISLGKIKHKRFYTLNDACFIYLMKIARSAGIGMGSRILAEGEKAISLSNGLFYIFVPEPISENDVLIKIIIDIKKLKEIVLDKLKEAENVPAN